MSDHLLGELHSAEDMEVYMLHRLSAEFAAVVDDPESFIDARRLDYFRNRIQNITERFFSFFRGSHIENIVEVLLRNDQDMYRSRRINILKCQHLIIFKNFGRRDLALYDITE